MDSIRCATQIICPIADGTGRRQTESRIGMGLSSEHTTAATAWPPRQYRGARIFRQEILACLKMAF